jgi:hypothetical protein
VLELPATDCMADVLTSVMVASGADVVAVIAFTATVLVLAIRGLFTARTRPVVAISSCLNTTASNEPPGYNARHNSNQANTCQQLRGSGKQLRAAPL